MQRCIQLARLGSGSVAPNPLVGSIIVHGDEIIGEGYHSAFGAAHAEVEAIKSVQDKSLLKDSTLYVCLEPCSHHGKTPPCTETILQHGIRKVVVAANDPNPRVNGSGIEQLRSAGVEVICGVMREEALKLNCRFITFHTQHRPYIILKWAQSADGFTGQKGKNIRISNEESRIISHRWRSEEAAIMVGARTVLSDNPQLNTREWNGPSPARIIVDRSGNLNGMDHLHVFDGLQKTIIFTQNEDAVFKNCEMELLLDDKNSISSILNTLHAIGINSVLVEGGSKIHQLFLDAGIWDECRIFISNEHLESGIDAPSIPHGEMTILQIGDNRLLQINKASSL